ncbi:MAG TPA: DUF4249 domain-containing protein, partial [Chitinophagaceae bacterium]|nr:DUF4249 domain-containing protein [Chitinophagaceae bacterium]
MKDYFKVAAGCTMIMLLFTRCKQSYDPQIEPKNIKLLVVEGFLNSGQGSTTIRLSRTVNLKDTAIKPEIGAQVNVEGGNGSNFTLIGNTKGEYSIAQLILNNNVKYRLHIKTTDGKEYISDFTSVKYTPPIDSVTWQREDGGLRLYANAHDPQNATKYYQWKYEETWEFHSAFYASLKYIRDNSDKVINLVYKYPDHSVDTTIYKCWKTVNSSSVIIGSSEKLTTDVIYLPVQYIEPNSEKLSVLYSLNLKQYALSHDEYLFLQKMKKNTEQIGTLFDPQPSELSGNIHCLTDPNEIVIGYVEITQEQTKRIFIYNNQVNGWNYQTGCFQIIVDNNLDSIAKYARDRFPTVPFALSPLGSILQFYAADNENCVDCTIRGTNQKPFFWP